MHQQYKPLRSMSVPLTRRINLWRGGTKLLETQFWGQVWTQLWAKSMTSCTGCVAQTSTCGGVTEKPLCAALVVIRDLLLALVLSLPELLSCWVSKWMGWSGLWQCQCYLALSWSGGCVVWLLCLSQCRGRVCLLNTHFCAGLGRKCEDLHWCHMKRSSSRAARPQPLW